MNNIFNSRNTRMVILGIIDACIVILGSVGALYLRFDSMEIPEYIMVMAVDAWPAYIIITIAVMVLFKLYSRVWTYASSNELISILKASFVIEVLFVSYHMVSQTVMPRSYYPINFILIAMMFSVVRFSKRIIKALKNQKYNTKVDNYVMIIGAGSAASILIKELANSDTNSKAVCAIDDNVNKKGKYIAGIPIVGTRDDIERYVKKYDINEIIIALPSVRPSEQQKIIKICQATGVPVKILPSISKGLLTSSIMKEVRAVNYEDLLGRDPIVVNQKGINEFLSGKTVMVTGGGGSIGSELCRQIIKYNPKTLVIFDIYENNAYEIQMELERKYPDMDIETVIGSVRDYDRLEVIFRTYHPDVIYHAAAHKHVPLMEVSPNEAIKNNCLGTYNVAKLADIYKAEKFVLISTDKAVRPTNIMGATKRICEMIMQTFARKSEYTKYAAVRFGNVLGSNGSVIPLFLKQIESGGPVTVTHREITRFFMTIPEAVSLVLQAGLFAEGGEIFVLDMGNPVKIYDLAENLIRMKGFIPDKDIKIEITGLRPGEKLYEELLMDEEGLSKTDNHLIFVGQPIKFEENVFLDKLFDLIRAAYRNEDDIKERTAEVCRTYTITNN